MFTHPVPNVPESDPGASLAVLLFYIGSRQHKQTDDKRADTYFVVLKGSPISSITCSKWNTTMYTIFKVKNPIKCNEMETLGQNDPT